MNESQKKAIKKYKKKLKRITLDFSPAEAALVEHINKQPKKQTYIKDLIRKDMGLIPPKGYKFNENGELVIDNREAEKIKREFRRYSGDESTIEPIIDEKTFAEVQEKLNPEKK